MAGFVKGEVVVIPFPFSDLSGSKRRPALVLADLPGDDIILCQITSQNSSKDPFAIPLIKRLLKLLRLYLIFQCWVNTNVMKSLIMRLLADKNSDNIFSNRPVTVYK